MIEENEGFVDELFKKIVEKGVESKATDIHLVLNEKGLEIIFRINGKMQEYTSIEKFKGKRLINYIKFVSKLDFSSIFKPQTGSIELPIDEHIYYLRVSVLPSFLKDSLVIRVLNQTANFELEDICKEETTLEYLKNVCNQTNGLYLICGVTGSGKSTTLYSILDRLSASNTLNIVTLEDPIEIVKTNIIQINIQEGLGINYESCLKQILRHDPDVIMISEIRDAESAKLAIRCALTGHLVFATIHAASCEMVVSRLHDLGVTINEMQQVLDGVIHQKLVEGSAIFKYLDYKGIKDVLKSEK